MSDFTVDALAPTHVHTWTRYSIVASYLTAAGVAAANAASATWATANTAVFVPMSLPFPYLAQRAFWVNGATVATNADIGVYTLSGVRLWSAGSTAQSGANVPQYVTISGGLLLVPGQYYLAFVTAGTTTAFTGVVPASATIARMAGLVQQASAFPLPATATLASISTPAGFPLIGLTSTTTGF